MKTTLLTFVALTAFTGLVVAQPAAPVEERNPADGPFQPQVIKAGGTIPPTPTQIVKSHATMDTPVKKCRLTPIFLNMVGQNLSRTQ